MTSKLRQYTKISWSKLTNVREEHQSSDSWKVQLHDGATGVRTQLKLVVERWELVMTNEAIHRWLSYGLCSTSCRLGEFSTTSIWISLFSLLGLDFDRGSVDCCRDFKLRYVYKDMPMRAVAAPQMLVSPGFEPKRTKPPRRITQVLNWPSTACVVAEVALLQNESSVRNMGPLDFSQQLEIKNDSSIRHTPVSLP